MFCSHFFINTTSQQLQRPRIYIFKSGDMYFFMMKVITTITLIHFIEFLLFGTTNIYLVFMKVCLRHLQDETKSHGPAPRLHVVPGRGHHRPTPPSVDLGREKGVKPTRGMKLQLEVHLIQCS